MLADAPLLFDPEHHVYTVGGAVVPSVTQVLEPLQFLDGVPWSVLEAARKFGNHVHEAVHLWNVGTLDEEALDPHLVPYLAGWKLFMAQTAARVIVSEHRMVHRHLGYAGTLDSVLDFHKRRHIVDVKSGVVPKTVGAQTAAYREQYLHEGEGCSAIRYCVQLTGDGYFKLHKLTNGGDFNLFLAALTISKWRRKHS